MSKFTINLKRKGTAKRLHSRLFNVIKAKNMGSHKCKSLFFRVPFHVLLVSKTEHTPTFHSFEIISNMGDSLVISSNNKELVDKARFGLMESTKVMKQTLAFVKTPAQMVREAM